MDNLKLSIKIGIIREFTKQFQITCRWEVKKWIERIHH